MSTPNRPGDAQSDSSKDSGKTRPPSESTSRSGRSLKLLTKARQFFGRLSPRQGTRKDPPENISTIDNKDSGATAAHSTPPEDTVQTYPVDSQTGPVELANLVVVGKMNTPPNLTNDPKPEDLKYAIGQAETQTSDMKPILGGMKTVVDTTSQGNTALQTIDNINSTYLQPFEVFNTVVKELANVHPYAKIALAGLSTASQIILNQVNRDESILKLLSKIREIYELLINDGELEKISGMVDILVPMSKQILECARFVDKYSETKRFWMRLSKNIVAETDTTVKMYNDTLDACMQKFRDRAARDTLIQVYRMLEDLDRIGQDHHLDNIPYAGGAGVNTTKTCLDGTRQGVLDEITDWINSEDAERVFWLNGVAGSGKSAISHTVGRWLQNAGMLGSFFCFDRTREGDQRHEKLFSTIARDLADCDIGLRHTVADAVSTNASLKNTVDVLEQWQKFVLEPVSKSPTTGPIVIVIDALDESGPESSREHILQLLGGASSDLPSNFRILLTSRPLSDINDALHDKAHVRAKTMDSISPESTEQDIHLFVSHRLHRLCESFDEANFSALSKKADGLFEWVRLACEFITSTARGGYSPEDRFEMLIASSGLEGGSLLDHMYTTILNEVIHHSPKARARFQSSMRQMFSTLEPLPMASLNEMRRLFPKKEDRFRVELILNAMAPLLSGITDPSIPVRPLHASFYDFLTDSARSGQFFVDLAKSETHRDLAFASLGVMKNELRFNICGLETSYLRNTDVPDLAHRIKANISPHLSYSNRFWATHVRDAAFDARLGEEICSFVGKEYLVFWFEALSLLGWISNAHAALESGTTPLKTRDEYSDMLAIARDAQRFIRVFGGPISQSAPHLYLSALPFSPTKSVFASSVTSKLVRVPRVVTGCDEDWPSVQLLLTGHSLDVNSVALSPDGRLIASGSDDKTIRIWDIETSSLVGRPFEGHTDNIWSVMFFPDSQKIVSGSFDRTVRIWDARNGTQVGTPLEGHEDLVYSVAISPDGKLIASGSRDKTIRLWDAETHSQVGFLEGHEGPVYSVAFSPDGTRIASGSEDCTIQVWDVATRQQAGGPFTGHTEFIWSVAWSESPNGRLIASGSGDGTIRFWNPDTGFQLGDPLKGHTDTVRSVVFSSDSKHLVSGSDDYSVRVWDVVARWQVGEPLAEHPDSVNSVVISPDGNHVISGSVDHTVRVWDVRSSSQLSAALDRRSSPILSATFLEDAKHVISASYDGTIQIWDAFTGAPADSPFRVDIQSTLITAVTFSVARKWVVLALSDHSIQVWSFETRSQVGNTFRGHGDDIFSLVISLDGKMIISGSDDMTIRLWCTKTWVSIGEPLEAHDNYFRTLALLPENRTILSDSKDGTICSWDTKSRLPSGNRLAGHTSRVISIATSHNGKWIASGTRDGSIRLWDVTKGSCIGELKGHTNWVYSIAFSPTGEHLISGSGDRSIRIWDMGTLSQVGSPLVTHFILSLGFSPDGKWMVSRSPDGIICIWNFQTALQVSGSLPVLAASSSSISLPHRQMTMVDGYPLDRDDMRNPGQCHIRFSHILDHALRKSPSIIGIADWTDPVETDEEGWVMGPCQSRILWVPVHRRGHLYFYDRLQLNMMVIPGSFELDLSQMAHGMEWHKCWKI